MVIGSSGGEIPDVVKGWFERFWCAGAGAGAGRSHEQYGASRWRLAAGGKVRRLARKTKASVETYLCRPEEHVLCTYFSRRHTGGL
ncbi:hypothetical protein KCP77_11305 [Salmonella enterica subsp. enterica]|nr:hypothetical protein KCP77_11305 [Salmonella enterica subsp. enterica]